VRGRRNENVTAFAERVGDGRRRHFDEAAVAAPEEASSAWPAHDRRASDKTSSGHQAAPTPVFAERRTWATSTGYSVIACVDVEPTTQSGAAPQHNDLLWRLALRRMERCVRPGDQLCMLGGPRVAVVLGNGAHRVSPNTLGKRLARAMGDHFAVGATGLDLRVAIGIGAGTSDVEPSALTAAAMSSLRLTRDRSGTSDHGAPSALVAVTHVPEHLALAASSRAHPAEPGTTDTCRRKMSRQPRRLDRRVLVSLAEDLALSAPEVVPDLWSAPETADAVTSLTGSALRVLLVDPEAHRDLGARPVMEAVAAMTRRLGARPILSPTADVDAVLLDLYLAKPDVVVVVLQSEVPQHGAGPGVNGTWDRPARLTRALREAGTPVVALSVGASAAALAVCVEQGAVGLMHTDLLTQELTRQATRRLNVNGGVSQNGYDEPRGPGQLPAPYNALVHLTPSERRVLFHMMEGRSAAEIATTLVVSLTTVRSHIRSILRKLNVNSQLAAVALAFGTLPDQALVD